MMPALQKKDSDVPAVPMSELLARIANELRVLAWTGDKLQDAISPVVLANGRTDASSIATLQSLDLLSQSLLGIAQVVDALTRGESCQCVVDPAASCRGLTLSALAERISGARVETAHSETSDGQFDYFGDTASERQDDSSLRIKTAC